jgi:hypothetical protein
MHIKAIQKRRRPLICSHWRLFSTISKHRSTFPKRKQSEGKKKKEAKQESLHGFHLSSPIFRSFQLEPGTHLKGEYNNSPPFSLFAQPCNCCFISLSHAFFISRLRVIEVEKCRRGLWPHFPIGCHVFRKRKSLSIFLSFEHDNSTKNDLTLPSRYDETWNNLCTEIH